MRTKTIFGLLIILLLSVGTVYAAPPVTYSEQVVQSGGRVRLDCTVIKPWSSDPANYQYPIIAWANGWDTNNNDTTAGYKPGLIEWALDGPYIVVAANSRSPKEADLLSCLQWIVNKNSVRGSEYYGVVNTSKIGLVGHSQGGGVAIKAGDGEPNGFHITAVVAMNPYAPNWNGASSQDGPVMVIGGTADTITPVSTYTQPAWDAIKAGDKGGLMTVLQGGDHNSDAWAPPGVDPTTTNFGNYQEITNLWWRYHLNDNESAGWSLKNILDQFPWDTQYEFTPYFQLP